MKILEWTWENFPWKWEFVKNNEIPDVNLCTSVVWMVFYNENLLLTRNKRWWELPCGHIEEWEILEETLKREIKEEVWAEIINSKLIWYFKIYPNKKVQKKDGSYYPYPNSYIPLYLCESENIWDFTGEEILETKQDRKSVV